MPQIVFCTFFDSNYLAQGLSMINSLFKVTKESIIYVFPTDDASLFALNNLIDPRLKVISLSEIKNEFPEIENIKKERSVAEFSYTFKGFICQYIFNNYKSFDFLTYLDSDLFFFSSPMPIFKELKNSSVGITSHNFHWLNYHQKKYGDFNAGWISFKNNKEAFKCLEEWRRDCTDWCFAYLEADKYADQKYLNSWPKKYTGVNVIKNKGANVAPWNVKKFNLKFLNGEIYIDNHKLIFYHFSNLIQIKKNIFKTNLSRVFVKTNGILKYKIYIPYIKSLISNNYKVILSKNKNNFSFTKRILEIEKKIRGVFFNDIIQF